VKEGNEAASWNRAGVGSCRRGSGIAQQALVTLQQPDKDFLTKASQGNVSEIKLGQHGPRSLP
jgi:hypothetical protein